MRYSLGIDPGWASLGLALIGRDHLEHGSVITTWSCKPKDYGTSLGFLQEMESVVPISRLGVNVAYVERYVSYGGVTTDPEKILMLIGALEYYLMNKGIQIYMVRAIDWKPKICKHLVRTKKFNNPYPSFDKKYSLLAAKELSGIDLKSDHEADAICLAYLDEVDIQPPRGKGMESKENKELAT